VDRASVVERASDALGRSSTRAKFAQESSKSSFNRSLDPSRRTLVVMAIRPASPLCSFDRDAFAIDGPGVEDPFPAHRHGFLPDGFRCAPRASSDWVRTVPTHARDALASSLRAESESVPPSPHASRALASGRRSPLPLLGASPENGGRSLRNFS
jgi:hypothetical protein